MVEIIISDNASIDDTVSLLRKIQKNYDFKLIEQKQTIPSAEEHVYSCLNYCEGEYIWILGDDDIPNLNVFKYLIEELQSNTSDIYVFNHNEIFADGSLFTSRIFKMNAQFLELNGYKIFMATGFISNLSMFSNVVFKRTYADINIAKEISLINPIYSHVAWYFKCFFVKRWRIVNFSLVNHRVDSFHIQNYFDDYHKTKNVSKFYIWTTGVLKLFNYLIKCDTIKANEFSKIYENDFDGKRYRLLDKICYYFYVRLRYAYLDSKKNELESLNLITAIEMEEVSNALISMDAGLQDQILLLKSINEEIQNGSRNKRKLLCLAKQFENVHARQTGYNMYKNIDLGIFYGYNIFETVEGFVAIHQDMQSQIDNILQYLDPHPYGSLILSSKDINSLLDQAQILSNISEQKIVKQYLLNDLHNIRIDSFRNRYYSNTLSRWFGKFLLNSKSKLFSYIKSIKYNIILRLKWRIYIL